MVAFVVILVVVVQMDAFDAAPLCPSPSELRLEQVRFASDEIVVVTAARRYVVQCPKCGHAASRVHSRYRRTLADLPWHGLRVRLEVSVRKFFCDTAACPRRIFTERLPATAAPYARRTARATDALGTIGLALGGAAGARLAAVLGLTASANTVLRHIRNVVLPEASEPRAVGLDDWAWRKGMKYGTIVVDLEAGCVLDLLPDRDADTVAVWLREHPGIEVISRDRASCYAEAARRGAPEAVQVADRFHLVKNLGEAVQRVLVGHAGILREVAQALVVALGSAGTPRSEGKGTAEGARTDSSSSSPTPVARPDRMPERDSPEIRASAESRDRRHRRYEKVVAMRAAGATLGEIAIALGMSVTTIHRWVHSDGFPERARHRRATDTFTDAIRRQWTAGYSNATAIWQALQGDGFTGSKRTVQRELGRLGLAGDILPGAGPGTTENSPRRDDRSRAMRPPSPRHIGWLFGRPDTAGTPDDRRFIGALCTHSPELATVRELAQRFVRLVVSRDSAAYDAWLSAAGESELRGFARSLRSDDDAVRAALSTPWSNGPTEGHINRLKLIKRTMYGRGKLDLLRARVLVAA